MPLSSVIIVDHGGLIGLGDDDHTQYALPADLGRGGNAQADGNVLFTGPTFGNTNATSTFAVKPSSMDSTSNDIMRIEDATGARHFTVRGNGFIYVSSSVHWSNGSFVIATSTPKVTYTNNANDEGHHFEGTGVKGYVHLKADNRRILFGAANDAGSWYDGTDWIFDAQLVGAGLHRINNAIALPIVTKTANYTATKADHTILCDASGGAFTITLPAAGTVTGIIYNIKKIDSSANNVTIDGDGAETIDGDPTAVITMQYESLTIQPDGTSWYIL